MIDSDPDTQLLDLANNLNRFINDLEGYINSRESERLLINNDNENKKNTMTNCQYISKDRSNDGKDHILCYHVESPKNNNFDLLNRDKKNLIKTTKKSTKSKKATKTKKPAKRVERLADKPIVKKIIDGKVMGQWGDEWLPVCDGSGFPYVEGCYTDASNWSPEPKQCIIENPATTNLASGSLYTCGFLW